METELHWAPLSPTTAIVAMSSTELILTSPVKMMAIGLP